MIMARKQVGLSESQIADKFMYDDKEEILEPSDHSDGKVLSFHLSLCFNIQRQCRHGTDIQDK